MHVIVQPSEAGRPLPKRSAFLRAYLAMLPWRYINGMYAFGRVGNGWREQCCLLLRARVLPTKFENPHFCISRSVKT
jgi:hypothetical protein